MLCKDVMNVIEKEYPLDYALHGIMSDFWSGGTIKK